jgi:hypothetical protein
VATIAAGVLIGAGIIWELIVNRDRPQGSDDKAERLHYFDGHAGELIAAATIRAVGFLLIIFVVVHLYRATRARNPQLPSISLVLGVLGAVLLAVGSLVYVFSYASDASDFAAQSFASAEAADKAAEDATPGPFLLLPGSLALAVWSVIASLNGMRVGLLTRFMGVLGIVIGPGLIFGFAPLVMAPWLIALGVMFLGHWRGGLPPAWESGQAQPWPGREQVGEPPDGGELEDAGGSRNGEVEAVGPGVRPASDGQSSGSAPARRKRKRRR